MNPHSGFNEKKDLPLVVRVALRPFKPMTSQARSMIALSRGHITPIAWHMLTTRQRQCLKELAWELGFRANFNVQPPIYLFSRARSADAQIPELTFPDPRQLAAWLIAEYAKRKEADSGRRPECV